MDKKQVKKFNDIRRVCQLWVKENKPDLYAALQEVLGIKQQEFKQELYDVLRKAEELLKQRKED